MSKVRATVTVTVMSASYTDRASELLSTKQRGGGGSWQLITSTLHLWDGRSCSLLPLAPACPSLWWLCGLSVSASDLSLWHKTSLRLSLASVHPAAFKVFLTQRTAQPRRLWSLALLFTPLFQWIQINRYHTVSAGSALCCCNTNWQRQGDSLSRLKHSQCVNTLELPPG